MDVFGLEGLYDRPMIDQMQHEPAHYALRVRLAHWFGGRERATEAFAAAGYEVEALLADAAGVECPYQIDVPRKVRLAAAKLTGEPVNRV